MKQFRVMEYGKEVWVQPYGESVKKYIMTNSFYDYFRNQYYFDSLMEVIGRVLEDVDLVLEVTKEGSNMMLYLTNSQLPLAEDIRSELLKAFPDDIEQVILTKNKLKIMDFFPIA